VDLMMVIEGGVLSAVAVAWARRKRPRTTKIRREPIDLAELTTGLAVAGTRKSGDDQELADALEAEIMRINRARKAPAVDANPILELSDPALSDPELEAELVIEAEVPALAPAVREPRAELEAAAYEPMAYEPAVYEGPLVVPSEAGLPLDQIRAWLEQVKDDLRQVQARVQHLEHEQVRLQDQHELVAELMTSSSPV
jgi:hypothetical protein